MIALLNSRIIRLRMMTNIVSSSSKSYHLGTRIFIRFPHRNPTPGALNNLVQTPKPAVSSVRSSASASSSGSSTMSSTTTSSNNNTSTSSGTTASCASTLLNRFVPPPSLHSGVSISPAKTSPFIKPVVSNSLPIQNNTVTAQPSFNQNVKAIFGKTPISLSTTTSSTSVVNPNLTGLHLKNSEVNLYQIITGPLAGKLFCGIPLRDGSNNLTGFTFGRIFSTKRNFRDVNGNLDYNEPIASTTLKSFPGIQFASPVIFQKDSSLGQPTYQNNQALNTTLCGEVEQDVCYWAKHFSKGLNRFSSFVTNALNGEIDPNFDYDPNNR